jgi:hypothetical protein
VLKHYIYVYQVDLLWVWSGWDVSIISYSTLLVRLQVNHLPLPLWLWDWWDQAYIRVTSLWLLAAVDSEGAETLYVYIWTRPVMSMKWMGCLNHNIHLNPSETPSESPTAISRWVCILMTTGRSSRCWNALYICMNLIFYEYALGGVPQSKLTHNPSETPSESPTTACDCETQHIRLGLHPDDCQPQ